MFRTSALPLLFLAGAVMAGPPTAAAADRPGNSTAGAQLAQSLCSGCHAVGAHGSGTDMAPTLPAVAAQRSDEAMELFLAAPHGSMPPVSLTRQQIADLVAYMSTLRPVSPPPAR